MVEGSVEGCGAAGVGDVCGAGAEETVVGVDIEPCGAPTEGGEDVAVGVGDALDEAMEAEPA